MSPLQFIILGKIKELLDQHRIHYCLPIYIYQFTLKVKLQEQTTVTTTEKKRQLMDNFPFYCLVFNSEGYHDNAQSLQSNQINLKALKKCVK